MQALEQYRLFKTCTFMILFITRYKAVLAFTSVHEPKCMTIQITGIEQSYDVALIVCFLFYEQ